MQKKIIIDKFQSLLLRLSLFPSLYPHKCQPAYLTHAYTHVSCLLWPTSCSSHRFASLLFVTERKHFIQNSINSLRPKPNNTCFMLLVVQLVPFYLRANRLPILNVRFFPLIQFERVQHNRSSIHIHIPIFCFFSFFCVCFLFLYKYWTRLFKHIEKWKCKNRNSGNSQ